MSKFEEKLLQWNFKKIAKIYIIAVVIAAVGCAAAAGIVFRNRIAFAWQYSRVNEAVEEHNTAILPEKAEKLAAASSDVVDILILDSSNHVLYSAKNSAFAQGQFNLTKSEEDQDYFVSDANPDVVFKYVKGDEFMLDSVFNTDFGIIRSQYDDDVFFERGFSNKTVYMLSYLREKNSGSKIYMINDPTSVAGGMPTLTIVATVAVLLFMIYWVLLALWACQNALRSKLYPLFWGVIVLLTNVAGVIVLLLYKRGNATCPVCGASQSKLHLYCTNCGAQLGVNCKSCGAHIGKKDLYCPNCGERTE